MNLNWTWRRFEDLGVRNLYDALALRCQVFILEQGAFQDPDGTDDACWHLLGRGDDGALHAYLRVVDPGIKYIEPSIGRVVTSPAARGQGLGILLMQEGLRRAQAAWPGEGVRISAQARLKRFYSGFGFTDVGSVYSEDDIPHQEMLLAGAPLARQQLATHTATQAMP